MRIAISLSLGWRESRYNSGCGTGGPSMMTWEDDEFEEYTKLTNKATRQNEIAAARADLLEKQANREWADLRDTFLQLIKRFNVRANSEILTSVTPRFERLDIRLNDNRKFEAFYDGQKYRVEFVGERCNMCKQQFGLTVRPVGGIDKVVWVDGNDNTQEAEAIAQSLLSNFIRSGYD